jgi:hypothetical protein
MRHASSFLKMAADKTETSSRQVGDSAGFVPNQLAESKPTAYGHAGDCSSLSRQCDGGRD